MLLFLILRTLTLLRLSERINKIITQLSSRLSIDVSLFLSFSAVRQGIMTLCCFMESIDTLEKTDLICHYNNRTQDKREFLSAVV